LIQGQFGSNGGPLLSYGLDPDHAFAMLRRSIDSALHDLTA
jgi:hypothetical protein